MINANGLTPEQMMRISSDLGFSESAFVSKSNKADFRVRFFSSNQEVDLCGHATIATFHTLAEHGQIKFDSDAPVIKTQESGAGVLPVTCYRDGLVMMTQTDPRFDPEVNDRSEVAVLLNISPDALEDMPIQSVSTGTPKLMIPLKSRQFLFDIKPNLSGIAEYCRQNGTKGFYPFTTDTLDKDSDFHARQFNPLAGINEDPITGVAAGALGAYIAHHKFSPKTKFVIEQGYVMNKAGNIIVDVSKEVRVGGYAVRFGHRTIRE
jgi:PhzF family phenazine biosynthesis protein